MMYLMKRQLLHKRRNVKRRILTPQSYLEKGTIFSNLFILKITILTLTRKQSNATKTSQIKEIGTIPTKVDEKPPNSTEIIQPPRKKTRYPHIEFKHSENKSKRRNSSSSKRSSKDNISLASHKSLLFEVISKICENEASGLTEFFSSHHPTKSKAITPLIHILQELPNEFNQSCDEDQTFNPELNPVQLSNVKMLSRQLQALKDRERDLMSQLENKVYETRIREIVQGTLRNADESDSNV